MNISTQLKNKPSKKWKQFNFDSSDIVKRELIDLTDECETIQSYIKTDFNFEKAVAPQSIEDLAVHKKKIKDVESWLDNVLNSEKKNTQSILLLTGPTGCGKTATIKVLCKIKNIEIAEWINPMDKDFELFRQPGQTAQLMEFLTESKYPSLLSSKKSKITLIEDYPNSVIHNPSDFFTVLEKCYTNKIKVVFICTDASSMSLNLPQLLFPEEIRTKYTIYNVCFNSCSITLLKHALRRAQNIVEEKSHSLQIPDASVIESIASSAMGDIRCAINQFYFACLKGCDALPTVLNEGRPKPGTKRKRIEKPLSKIKNMNKDESLGLFHSLGRILNPKRLETNDKWKFQCDVNSLIDELCTQPNTLNGFLFENYLKYFGDIKDVSKAVDVLSLSQRFLSCWWDKDNSFVFALWLSVMGLMVHNEHKVSQWNAIRKPKIFRKIVDGLVTREISTQDRCYYNIITNNEKFHYFELIDAAGLDSLLLNRVKLNHSCNWINGALEEEILANFVLPFNQKVTP